MEKEKKKIILPKELQIEMMKFFMQTSIPRIKQEQERDKSELSKEKR